MNERLSKIFTNPKTIPISIGVISFGIGTGLGYLVGFKRRKKVTELETKNQLEFDFKPYTLNDIKTSVDGGVLENHIDDSDLVGPNTMVGKAFLNNKFNEIIDTDINGPTIKEIVEYREEAEAQVTLHSVFAKDDDTWNYAEEVAKRTSNEPYIIHKDEFFGEESGYAQSVLTFYKDDDILCDEDNTPIYNYEERTGPLRFGHGSGDQNVLYVRNDKRRAEYEILFDSSSYAEEVLGIGPEAEEIELAEELKHSKLRKFRPE